MWKYGVLSVQLNVVNTSIGKISMFLRNVYKRFFLNFNVENML